MAEPIRRHWPSPNLRVQQRAPPKFPPVVAAALCWGETTRTNTAQPLRHPSPTSHCTKKASNPSNEGQTFAYAVTHRSSVKSTGFMRAEVDAASIQASRNLARPCESTTLPRCVSHWTMASPGAVRHIFVTMVSPKYTWSANRASK